jgi:CheY-like chemotaxis protein
MNDTKSASQGPSASSVDPSVERQSKLLTNERTHVIDAVFNAEGFGERFLDSGEGIRRPHFDVTCEDKPLVLHIDDDADLVDALTVRLTASGYRVASALDGVAGMATALVNPARVIILDYDMPNARGDVVIDRLKNDARTKHVPVIVLTAVHENDLKRKMIAKGASEFMTKPFEFETLDGVIARLIESQER